MPSVIILFLAIVTILHFSGPLAGETDTVPTHARDSGFGSPAAPILPSAPTQIPPVAQVPTSPTEAPRTDNRPSLRMIAPGVFEMGGVQMISLI